jgi:hypothetical protein
VRSANRVRFAPDDQLSRKEDRVAVAVGELRPGSSEISILEQQCEITPPGEKTMEMAGKTRSNGVPATKSAGAGTGDRGKARLQPSGSVRIGGSTSLARRPRAGRAQTKNRSAASLDSQTDRIGGISPSPRQIGIKIPQRLFQYGAEQVIQGRCTPTSRPSCRNITSPIVLSCQYATETLYIAM